MDAAADGATGCTAGDNDADGVCDDVDVCPGVFDPAQVDLDGDGHGWMCDPKESVAIHDPGLARFGFAAHLDTVAVRLSYSCDNTGACTHELIAAGPSGKAFVSSDSLIPQDAWAAQPYLDGPNITADQRVLWSRGFVTDGDTGELVLASGAFEPRTVGTVDRTASWSRSGTTQGCA